MAHFVSALVFSFALIGAVIAIAAMLRRDWARISMILTGEEVRYAVSVRLRVRIRSRARTEPLRLAPLAAAA